MRNHTNLVPLSRSKFKKLKIPEISGWRGIERVDKNKLEIQSNHPVYLTDRSDYNKNIKYPHWDLSSQSINPSNPLQSQTKKSFQTLKSSQQALECDRVIQFTKIPGRNIVIGSVTSREPPHSINTLECDYKFISQSKPTKSSVKSLSRVSNNVAIQNLGLGLKLQLPKFALNETEDTKTLTPHFERKNKFLDILNESASRVASVINFGDNKKTLLDVYINALCSGKVTNKEDAHDVVQSVLEAGTLYRDKETRKMVLILNQKHLTKANKTDICLDVRSSDSSVHDSCSAPKNLQSLKFTETKHINPSLSLKALKQSHSNPKLSLVFTHKRHSAPNVLETIPSLPLSKPTINPKPEKTNPTLSINPSAISYRHSSSIETYQTSSQPRESSPSSKVLSVNQNLSLNKPYLKKSATLLPTKLREHKAKDSISDIRHSSIYSKMNEETNAEYSNEVKKGTKKGKDAKSSQIVNKKSFRRRKEGDLNKVNGKDREKRIKKVTQLEKLRLKLKEMAKILIIDPEDFQAIRSKSVVAQYERVLLKEPEIIKPDQGSEKAEKKLKVIKAIIETTLKKDLNSNADHIIPTVKNLNQFTQDNSPLHKNPQHFPEQKPDSDHGALNSESDCSPKINPVSKLSTARTPIIITPAGPNFEGASAYYSEDDYSSLVSEAISDQESCDEFKEVDQNKPKNEKSPENFSDTKKKFRGQQAKNLEVIPEKNPTEKVKNKLPASSSEQQGYATSALVLPIALKVFEAAKSRERSPSYPLYSQRPSDAKDVLEPSNRLSVEIKPKQYLSKPQVLTKKEARDPSESVESPLKTYLKRSLINSKSPLIIPEGSEKAFKKSLTIKKTQFAPQTSKKHRVNRAKFSDDQYESEEVEECSEDFSEEPINNPRDHTKRSINYELKNLEKLKKLVHSSQEPLSKKSSRKISKKSSIANNECPQDSSDSDFYEESQDVAKELEAMMKDKPYSIGKFAFSPQIAFRYSQKHELNPTVNVNDIEINQYNMDLIALDSVVLKNKFISSRPKNKKRKFNNVEILELHELLPIEMHRKRVKAFEKIRNREKIMKLRGAGVEIKGKPRMTFTNIPKELLGKHKSQPKIIDDLKIIRSGGSNQIKDEAHSAERLYCRIKDIYELNLLSKHRRYSMQPLTSLENNFNFLSKISAN